MGGFNFDMSILFWLLEVQLCMSWPVARQWSWGASPKLFTMLQFQLAYLGLVTGFLFFGFLGEISHPGDHSKRKALVIGVKAFILWK